MEFLREHFRVTNVDNLISIIYNSEINEPCPSPYPTTRVCLWSRGVCVFCKSTKRVDKLRMDLVSFLNNE